MSPRKPLREASSRRGRFAACATLLLLSLFPATLGATTSFEELKAAAIANDTSRKSLELEEERARLAVAKAALEGGKDKLALRSGDLSLGPAGGGVSFSASPGLEAETAKGWTFKADLPFVLGTGASLSPRVSVGIPLGPPPAGGEAMASAEAALEAARTALGRRSLEVEKELALALGEAYAARAAREEARRGVEKARSSLEKARLLDGLEPGGAAALSLEREIRGQERKERDAARAEDEAIAVLARLTGLPNPGLPEALPSPGLDQPLPPPETLATVRDALAAVARAMIAAEESGRKTDPSLEVGASYDGALEYGAIPARNALTVDAALRLALGDLDFEAKTAWRADFTGGASGPSLGLAFSWKAGREASRGLVLEEGRLDLESARVRATAALLEARRTLAGLETRRAALLSRREDIAEDLAFALRERRLYELWLEKGAVGEAEYEEVLAFAREAQSRMRGEEIEALVWTLDLALLASGTR